MIFQRNHAILTKAVIADMGKSFVEQRINDSLLSGIKDKRYHTGNENPLTNSLIMYRSPQTCCLLRNMPRKRQFDVDHSFVSIYSQQNLEPSSHMQPATRKRAAICPTKRSACLINRNKRYYSTIKELKKSLNNLDMGRGWEREIDNHYETCVAYGFGKRQLGDPSRWKYTPN